MRLVGIYIYKTALSAQLTLGNSVKTLWQIHAVNECLKQLHVHAKHASEFQIVKVLDMHVLGHDPYFKLLVTFLKCKLSILSK